MALRSRRCSKLGFPVVQYPAFSQPPGGDRLQAALTSRFLRPVRADLEALFWTLRAEADAALSAHPPRDGRAYPYGACKEICVDVLARLAQRLRRPRLPAERALVAFSANRGVIRQQWGVLREAHFHNALEVGSLYVDVSNDTVDLAKPKVEILPMRESGLALIEGPGHFVRIAELYWKVRVYANTILPGLAPLFPFLAIDENGRVQLHSKTYYMRWLFIKDGFRDAEHWLTLAPEPSGDLTSGLRALCPEDVLATSPVTGREAAVAACRDLRARRGVKWEAWDREMCALYDRVPVVQWTGSTSQISPAAAPNLVA